MYVSKAFTLRLDDALRQGWLKLAHWFLRRRFLKIVNVFWQFRNYLPLENTLILLTQGCLLPRLVEIGPVVLENKIFEIRQCIYTIS